MNTVNIVLKQTRYFFIFLTTFIGTVHAAGKSSDYEMLSAKMSNASQSQIRVIVELNSNLPPGIETAGSDAVRAIQSGVLSNMSAGSYSHVKMFSLLPMIAMKVNADALIRLKNSQRVRRIYEDRLERASQFDPGDIDRPQLYDSTKTVQADRLWELGITGRDQAVAVLDTGVRTSHEMFSGRVVAESCFSTSDPPFLSSACPNGASTQFGPGAARPPYTADGHEHGTHVAGIVMGDRQGILGGTLFADGDGVAREGELIAINVFSKVYDSTFCNGLIPCAGALTSDVARGLEHVYRLRNSFAIAAVNLSLGGGRYTSHCDSSDPRTWVVNRLHSAGIAVVAASGNDGYTNAVSAPACISKVIAVGSTFYSGSPISSFSNSAVILDLLAPGGAISSASAGSNNGYTILSGTSMAAPHVAGAFALLKSATNNATTAQIEAALKSQGRPMRDSRNGVTRSLIQLLNTRDFLPPGTGDIIPALLLLLDELP